MYRDSRDARDVKKRDREKLELEGERENSKFKFKLLAGKFWVLGTLGTGKKETERNREVRKRAGKFKFKHLAGTFR